MCNSVASGSLRFASSLVFCHPKRLKAWHQNPPSPPLNMLLNKQTKTNIHLSTRDLLVRATMKNAAKRDM